MNKLRRSQVFLISLCSAMVSAVLCQAQTPDSSPSKNAEIQQSDNTNSQTPKPTSPRRGIPPIGLDIGVFSPIQSTVRSRFGGSWISIGPGFGGFRTARPQGKIEPNFTLISTSKGVTRAFIPQLGVIYKKSYPTASENNTPFLGIGPFCAPTYLRSPADNINYGIRMSYGMELQAGVNIGRRGLLQVSYLESTRVRNLDLSGIRFVAGVRF